MRFVVLVAATAVLLHADTRCLPCHAQYVQSWTATGMGRSIRRAAPESRSLQNITHKLSATTFRVRSESDKVIHESNRKGRRAVYVPAWVIGSGGQGESYIHRIRDALFQSPISWYAERHAYDMSPGFETDPNPDFFRPVTPECLFCHSGASRPVAGTQNRYLDPPFQPAAIDCDRCHGDPTAHLRHPNRASIVNPARLAPELRDGVCEQCHLSGEARIPNPGRDFADFRPGMRMEDVFSVYVRGERGNKEGLKVVSHSEQLASSQCLLKSGGKLWCATCHDPHAEPANKVAWYREKCLGCHPPLQTGLHEQKAGRDCAGCHMRRIKAYDGGHTAFTDHWIRVGTRSGADGKTDVLRAWREPPAKVQKRNLGLASISVGVKTGEPDRAMTGFRLLDSELPDGAVDSARGMMLLRLNKPAEAISALRRALAEQPKNSTRHFNLAVALFASGDREGAMRHVEEAISIEPLLEDAYVLAAEINPKDAGEWKARYRKLVPQRFLP